MSDPYTSSDLSQPRNDLQTILRPMRLTADMLTQPSPCDLFNQRGLLLVRCGAPLAAMALNTASGPVYCRATDAALISDFDPALELRRICNALSRFDQRIQHNEQARGQELVQLACDLHQLWQIDADVLLGLARLQPYERPSIAHALHVALLAAELATAQGAATPQIIDIMGAALSMNLAGFTLHDQMFERRSAPDELEGKKIAQHPSASLRLLDHLGHFSMAWRNAVAAHHENVDGTGYPHALRGSQIPLAARMLRITDTFAARLSGRRGRLPVHWSLRASRSALTEQLFGHDLERMDRSLVALLNQRLGTFPPGSLVQLNTGELAVCSRRNRFDDDGQPMDVLAIRDLHGQVYAQPQRRRLHHGRYSLRRYANDEAMRLTAHDWSAVWGYSRH